jgi:hypothetical protein
VFGSDCQNNSSSPSTQRTQRLQVELGWTFNFDLAGTKPFAPVPQQIVLATPKGLAVFQHLQQALLEPDRILLAARSELEKLLRDGGLHRAASLLFRKSENHLVQDALKAHDFLGIENIESDFPDDRVSLFDNRSRAGG